MPSSPTDSRSSESLAPAEARADSTAPAYLWAWDAGTAARAREEIAVPAGGLPPLPPRAAWGERLPSGPFAVLVALAGEESLPPASALATLHAAGARPVALLPACDERCRRRLLRRGFHEALGAPFTGLDLELILADPDRAHPLDRRLPDFERRVKCRLRFSVPAELRYVAPAAAFLCRLAREHGFPPQVWAEALPLALDEALVNAIRHGCGLDPDKEVRVTARFGPRQLRVRIADPGAGFDPTQVADPTSAAGLRRRGGRGVLLIRELVDRVDYQEGGRVVLLTLRRREPGRD